jgi:hypothetical protein
MGFPSSSIISKTLLLKGSLDIGPRRHANIDQQITRHFFRGQL